MRSALLALLVLTVAVPGVALGLTITDTATGSLTPSVAPFDQNVLNGDFLILSNLGCVPQVACPTGDGSDETTVWTFDFTADPDFPSFPPGGPLVSAALTLTLTPKNGLITTDLVRIEGLANIITPVIQGLPVDVTSTISLELLDFYSSGDILGILGANAGQLPMVYGDDSIVSFARMDLSVPEPSILFVLASGLAGAAARGWATCRRRASRQHTKTGGIA